LSEPEYMDFTGELVSDDSVKKVLNLHSVLHGIEIALLVLCASLMIVLVVRTVQVANKLNQLGDDITVSTTTY
jgi:hypothetical protein